MRSHQSSDFVPGPGRPGLVSIIIPTYNRANFIGETIESALTQSYHEHEIIVVDDGSTDETGEVVAGFRDSRIRYVRIDVNGGFARARNIGLRNAEGAFVAFLDSDDIWLPWKLEAQIALFEKNPDVGMIWSDMWIVERDGQRVEKRYLRELYDAYSLIDFHSVFRRRGTLIELTRGAPSELMSCSYYVGDIADQMFFGNLVHPPTVLIRRETLSRSGAFEPGPTGNAGVDYDFYYRLTREGPAAILDAPTMYYRLHPAQISKQVIDEARADLQLVLNWPDDKALDLPAAAVRRRIAGSHRWLGEAELFGGVRSEGRRHLWRSLKLMPAQPTTLGLFVLSLFPDATLPTLRSVRRGLRRALTR